ncbi:MAG: hypothetical protein CMJ32_02105 [Phycisphaerae bacterium]|nr:hypothetical protein [Phycisphaerae bacterium]
MHVSSLITATILATSMNDLLDWLLIACLLPLGWWVFALAWLAVTHRSIPHVRSGLSHDEDADGRGTVSIIIPAHDESPGIAECVRSLLQQQYDAIEVIVVLDRCTDDSRDLLRQFQDDRRLQVIEVDECPPDWAGKNNAAATGTAAAGGEWLLFADADTRFSPELVGAAVGCATRDGSDLLSLVGGLTNRTMSERVFQPVASLMLMSIYPIQRANRRAKQRPFANGQFMLFRRSCYEGIGGHAAVKDDLLEDLAFALKVKLAGYRPTVAMGSGLFEVSMYDSFSQMTSGWRRILIEACRRNTSRMRRYAVRLIFFSTVVPSIQLFTLVVALVTGPATTTGTWAIIVVGMGLLAQWLCMLWIYRLCGSLISSVIFYPIGAVMVAIELFKGAGDLQRRRPICWGGREYVLEPRKERRRLV